MAEATAPQDETPAAGDGNVDVVDNTTAIAASEIAGVAAYDKVVLTHPEKSIPDIIVFQAQVDGYALAGWKVAPKAAQKAALEPAAG